MSEYASLSAAASPALVLDRPRFEANCRRMIEHVRTLGVKLRPHLKTLKSAEAARAAIDPLHGGIAVSTFAEAEYFADAGHTDIQLALCPAPDKLPRALALAARAPGFGIFVDSIETAEALARAAAPDGARLRVWIEVDSGEHRTGVPLDDPALLAVAFALAAAPAVEIAGVATHAGHSYAGATLEAVAAIAEAERAAAVAAAERLRAAGYRIADVSAGSTPTALHGRSAAGLTELRAGVYMVGDLYQASIGSLAECDIAVSVLATVVSHNRARNQIVIDAGGLALSKDRSTQALPGRDRGYGLVTDINGWPRFGELLVRDVHQEHGEIRGEAPLPFNDLPIGAKVRVLPNHACMTAAMYDSFLVVEDGSRVVDEWHRVNGWLGARR